MRSCAPCLPGPVLVSSVLTPYSSSVSGFMLPSVEPPSHRMTSHTLSMPARWARPSSVMMRAPSLMTGISRQ